MASRVERVLILCKTYPSPSARYVETSCVAGISGAGELKRLYPIPFRLIQDEQQFKKWQWINARIFKSNTDNRPESYKIYVDTISCEPDVLSTKDNWRERRTWIEKVPIFDSFEAIGSGPKRIVKILVSGVRCTNCGAPAATAARATRLRWHLL